jgi:hypothetical protein
MIIVEEGPEDIQNSPKLTLVLEVKITTIPRDKSSC